MFTRFVVSALCLVSFSSALASGAHEHGAVKVDIAFDGLKGVVHFTSPAANIYGFEHEAKSAKDKKKRDEMISLLKTKFSEMVVWDAKAGCEVAPHKIDAFVKENQREGGDHKEHETKKQSKEPKGKKSSQRHQHKGQHGEVRGEFVISCKTGLSGTKVKFGFQKYFPAIKKIVVQAINGETQSGATIENDLGVVGL